MSDGAAVGQNSVPLFCNISAELSLNKERIRSKNALPIILQRKLANIQLSMWAANF